jgi:hypothetical protein
VKRVSIWVGAIVAIAIAGYAAFIVAANIGIDVVI